MADDLFENPVPSIFDTKERKSHPKPLSRLRGQPRSAADVLSNPAAAKSTMDQRIKYLNLPAVGRAMAIESAERKEPHRDTPTGHERVGSCK